MFSMYVRYGKWVFMMSSVLYHEILLNMLRISNEIRHLVGGLADMSSSCRVVYFSTSTLVVWYIQLDPSLTSIS